MREPVVIGNWKMHLGLAEARALAGAVVAGCQEPRGARVALCPPFTALAAVAAVVEASRVELGAQDAHWESWGAFTGAVSPAQVLDAGARLVLLGHSERRHVFGESDAVVARKVAAAVAHGLMVVLCVGETAAERAAGQTLAVVTRQVRTALEGREAAAGRTVSLAYEPVWAIGTGQTASPAQAQEVHAALRALVSQLAGGEAARACPILYGGSVKPELTPALCREPDIDGALVGGASLDATQFLGIVRAAAAARSSVPTG